MGNVSKLLISIYILIILCGCGSNYKTIETSVSRQDGYTITATYNSLSNRIIQTVTTFDDGKRVICMYQYDTYGNMQILTETIE